MNPVKIFKNEVLGDAVSGREVYSLVAASAASRDVFSEWFRHKQDKFGLVENTDFVTSSVILPGSSTKRGHIEFIVTLQAAKVLAKAASRSRGAGVVAFIQAYETTGVIPMVPGQPTPNEQPALDTTLFPYLASQHREPVTGPQVLTNDEKISELQKLGPDPIPLKQTAEITTITDSEVSALTSTTEDTGQLTPAQRLLRNAQQLVEEEQRIKAQQEQNRANAAEKPVQIGLSTEQLAAFESRLKNTEGRIDTILYFFQQASHALRSLDPVGLPTEHEEEIAEAAEPTPRNQLILLVNAYAAATEKPQRETWRYLYGQFSVRKGFNPYAYGPPAKDRDYLSIIEKHNLFDALFELAKQLFVLPELK